MSDHLQRFRDHFHQFEAERKAKDEGTFNMAHEIITSHGDNHYDHVPGDPDHQYSAFHGQPEHIRAAMSSLKQNGWKHPESYDGSTDEYSLHHDDTSYHLSYYPQSILGHHLSQLTVLGGPNKRYD